MQEEYQFDHIGFETQGNLNLLHLTAYSEWPGVCVSQQLRLGLGEWVDMTPGWTQLPRRCRLLSYHDIDHLSLQSSVILHTRHIKQENQKDSAWLRHRTEMPPEQWAVLTPVPTRLQVPKPPLTAAVQVSGTSRGQAPAARWELGWGTPPSWKTLENSACGPTARQLARPHSTAASPEEVPEHPSTPAHGRVGRGRRSTAQPRYHCTPVFPAREAVCY